MDNVSPWILLLILHIVNLFILATQTIFGNPFRAWDAVDNPTKEGQTRHLPAKEERVAALQAGLTALRAFLWVGVGVTLYLLTLRIVTTTRFWQVIFAVSVGLVLIISEWVMQTLTNVAPDVWEKRLQPFARLIAVAFSPLHVFVSRFVQKVVPPPEPTSSQEMAEELREWVDVAQEQGDIDTEQGRLLHSILELSDTLAREIMVPRVDIVALEKDMSLQEAAGVFIASGHSRLPLYKGTIDEVLGIIYAKDLLRFWVEERKDTPLIQLARPAYFIPEAKRIDELLNEMQQRRVHLAIVVDEYGGVAGLVTLEDIIEEILGEIQDEYDQAEELPFQEIGAGEVLFQGKIDLGDFNEIMATNFPKEEADTLGGFILQQLGRLPTAGEKLCVDGIELIIEQVSGRRIRKVRARRIDRECYMEEQNANG
ncbi:MAG: HlyC/CorC family transporter [Anaerolineae bacterium]|jgi:CBS domain containing-hemolysin-like protein|nr:MAG: HlyC/CorC family transporter [Anaerolineae bacterium]